MDFALNQKTASRLDFAAFLDLAADLGCVGVEPRNDLGRPLFDGIAPGRAAEMARERGLRFVGLSEVYPFNDWNAGPSRRRGPAQGELLLLLRMHRARRPRARRPEGADRGVDCLSATSACDRVRLTFRNQLASRQAARSHGEDVE